MAWKKMTRYLLSLMLMMACFPVMAGQSLCPGKFLNDETPNIHYDEEICFTEFVVLYSYANKAPLISAQRLTAERVRAAETISRRDSFHVEPLIPRAVRSATDDYEFSGYDQGHMTPAGDMPNSLAQHESFSMSNMTPQLPKLNRISWRKIEASVRKLALQDGEIWVVTGAVFGSKRIGNGVSVPTLIYKAIISQSVQQVFVGDNTTGVVTSLSISDFSTRYSIDPFPTRRINETALNGGEDSDKHR
ncbi:endonuclease [Dickeya dadantii]|uniref:Endonuclease n=1 Tax=Dickeya dadantii (strain 3937) TaxID=198628 RepID=E0SBA2_DICD3|nr:DNA/RNA non-specific endonuclease [Dickeya dadantii]ADM98371.1 Endonuclease [Dickeya dadantii 3937]NAT76155.1 DNA/RNA non-specific endonuclease [Dickeya dadantii]NPE62154.1 DNA/RNA non-specific endonuclease [Dickeya dadantii]OOC12694.1 endonuclease [Dickeya dadantii]